MKSYNGIYFELFTFVIQCICISVQLGVDRAEKIPARAEPSQNALWKILARAGPSQKA